MRLLILSCNTGEGHNAAAKAIREYFEKRNAVCDIKDAIAIRSPQKSRQISRQYAFVCRHIPKLFDALYRHAYEHRARNGSRSHLYKQAILSCDALERFLQAHSYDGIICTHVVSAMMLTELKRRGSLPTKTYLVTTDHVCHPGTEETSLDAYFIPSKELTEDFCKNGIPASKIIPTGIPAAHDFYTKLSKTEAKRKLGIAEDKKIVLLMGGSMGCGPIKALVKKLPKRLPENGMLIVICGSNRRLYNTLAAAPLGDKVQIIGYTDAVPLYMDAAELMLTKPGGLSCTEAAAKALPMIFFDVISPYEMANVSFFTERGCAQRGSSISALCSLTQACLDEPARLKDMSEALRKAFTGCAAEKIYDYIVQQEPF